MTVHSHPLDLLDDEFRAGPPLAHFTRLRAKSPVFRSRDPNGGQQWNLVRYGDVARALRATGEFGVTAEPLPSGTASTRCHRQLRAAMALNPPEHRLHTEKVIRALRQEAVEPFRSRALEVATNAIVAARRAATFEAVSVLAAPLAVSIAAAFLGLDDRSHSYIRMLSAAFMDEQLVVPENDTLGGMPLGVRARQAATGSPMRALTEFVYEAWQSSAWLPAQVVRDLDRWQFEEIALQTLTAGIVGLRASIVTMLSCLAREWETLARLHPLPDARLFMVADEVLRHATPLRRVSRVLLVNQVFHGQLMQPGDSALLWLVSANFDPSVFPLPKEFLPFRSPNPHLTFTTGLHRCAGVALVRLAMEEIVRAVLTGWRGLKILDGPEWYPSRMVAEPLTLWVKVR